MDSKTMNVMIIIVLTLVCANDYEKSCMEEVISSIEQ